MSEPVFSALAMQDLFETGEFIARDKIEAGFQWIESVESTCKMLASNSGVGELLRTKNYGPCRSFTLGNFAIIFRPFQDTVEIVRILRADRDTTRL